MTDRDTSKLLPIPEPEPDDHWCHVCGTRVRSYGSNRHPCPFGPHDEETA